MLQNSFWKKHANDPDWNSWYIDLTSSHSLDDFTQTLGGGAGATATLGSTGLVIVNSAGASDTIQYQFAVAQLLAQDPKVPTALDGSIYEYELEFMLTGIFEPTGAMQLFLGLCAGGDTTILPGHTDSMGLKSGPGSKVIGLDFLSNGVDGTAAVAAGGPNAVSTTMIPQDGLNHEFALQVVPKTGDATSGEVRVFVDGQMVAYFGPDTVYWVTLTQAYLAAAFALGNGGNASLTAAQRTATIARLGWAMRRAGA